MKALVIGGARSGTGAALLLLKMGYDVTLVANKDFATRLDLEAKGVEVVLDDGDTDRYDTYDLVIKNPGIPNSHPLVKRFSNVLNEIELAYLVNQKASYYCVSGTNGKTTTVTLLHDMLKRKDKSALLAGNVGVALSEEVYKSGDIKRDIALEISAFQMDNTPTLKPEVYALLNLSPDHLDRYESEDAYYEAKLKIIERANYFIRNYDDTEIMKRTFKTDHTIDVSLTNKTDVFVEEGYVWFRDVCLFEVKSLKLLGKHNLMNAMFASVMAYLAGVSLKDIKASIREFKGVEHRIEYVDTINDVAYYNDSKATNPESVAKALEAFSSPVILLAGGFDKHISFDLLKEYKDSIKHSVVYGDSKEQLHAVLVNSKVVDTLDAAFKEAVSIAKAGDVILLSPACASYDQFTDFEARGEYFKNLVKSLK